MSLLTVPPDAAPTPTTNRGVYPLPEWGECVFDYYRASVSSAVQPVLAALCEDLDPTGNLDFTADPKPAVAHYPQHRAITDRLGRVACSVFWGGKNVHPNVEAKGSQAPAVAAILRRYWPSEGHRPSRVDPMYQATREGLFQDTVNVMIAVASRHGLDPPAGYVNRHPDKGDTCYLGSEKSAIRIRVYQPGLKRAQEEGRRGDQITTDERNAVRCELQFRPDKAKAKLAAATMSPDALWGISPYVADFAAEVFAMNVQPVSISERRESDTARALRFMGSQYQRHIQVLWDECGHDPEQFATAILGLADIPFGH